MHPQSFIKFLFCIYISQSEWETDFFKGPPQLKKTPKISVPGRNFLDPLPPYEFQPYIVKFRPFTDARSLNNPNICSDEAKSMVNLKGVLILIA